MRLQVMIAIGAAAVVGAVVLLGRRARAAAPADGGAPKHLLGGPGTFSTSAALSQFVRPPDHNPESVTKWERAALAQDSVIDAALRQLGADPNDLSAWAAAHSHFNMPVIGGARDLSVAPDQLAPVLPPPERPSEVWIPDGCTPPCFCDPWCAQ